MEEARHLEEGDVDRKVPLKEFLEKQCGKVWGGFVGSGYTTVEDSSGHDNKAPRSTKGGKFLEHLSGLKALRLCVREMIGWKVKFQQGLKSQ